MWMWSLCLINPFNPAKNVAEASSLANAAFPVIFIFFSPSLLLNLCSHPLLAVKLVSLVSVDPWLQSSYRLSAFWCSTWPSVGTRFVFMSSIHRFNAFSILTEHLSVIFAVWGAAAKLAWISFSSLAPAA